MGENSFKPTPAVCDSSEGMKRVNKNTYPHTHPLTYTWHTNTCVYARKRCWRWRSSRRSCCCWIMLFVIISYGTMVHTEDGQLGLLLLIIYSCRCYFDWTEHKPLKSKAKAKVIKLTCLIFIKSKWI